MKLSIIVPVFNEQETVGRILGKVKRVKLPKGVTCEIIVVDDGSFDNTPKILKKLQGSVLKVYRHEKNLGKGAAVRTGLDAAGGDVFIIQDADLEYDPKYFSALLEPIMRGQAEVVYGNRFADYPLVFWGENKTVLPLHWIGNKVLSLFASLLYGVRLADMETCYKVFTKEVKGGLNLVGNRFEIEPEITAKMLKKGYKIVEVPIKVKPRTHKEGKKICWKDGFIAIWILMKYKFYN